ncbi:hypothetical protein IC229_19050 [Spirosoma sp. BT702]|uniref:T9SS C-terminal target domain-containing protein n=1 Tax=Spirosoma profusum TaxID=2771354 RepID=A0A926Y2R7_9BACT|nr:hypothetical protein [Spirosoma profusum]MBD2702753.1 hypothetical protein [Spirosoma profusum]
MKRNVVFLTVRLSAFLLLNLIGHVSASAQTYNGADRLRATPKGLDAVIWAPKLTPFVMRIHFRNPHPDEVRIVIRDEKGRIYYDEGSMKRVYAGRYDVSALPTGQYRVELSCGADRFVQSFTVNPPVHGYITMATQDNNTLSDIPLVRQTGTNN